MTLLTISAAARHCGVDRRTLQRAIASGRLILTASRQVTLEALQQAGYAAPVSQVTPQDAAGDAFPAAAEVRYAAAAPQPDAAAIPPELALATTLLAHLAELTRTIEALHHEVVLLREDLRQAPQRRRSITPHEAAHLPHHDALTPQETPQNAAPMSQGTPQEVPQVVRHAAAAPQSRPATAEGATSLPPHVLAIAEIAMQYDKLSLAELSQLLYDRGIYRAVDRATGAAKPVNRGTLKKWLDQARAAGVL